MAETINKDRFTLYSYPPSIQSRMVIVSLIEKKAVYKDKIINILNGGQLAVSFFRLNNKGEVPVLKDGDKIVLDTRNIIDYIDKEIPTEPKLVPDKTSDIGQEVERVRGILGKIPIEHIIYGCVFHPDLSESGLKLPTAFIKSQKKFEDTFSQFATRCSELADQHPDLRDAYLTKNQYFTQRIKECSDKESVQKAINNVEKIFDQMESLLKRNKKEGVEETWIVGTSFSAADITLATIIDRIVLLGLEPTLLSQEKRPELSEYWNRVSQRPSLVKARAYKFSSHGTFLKEKAKVILPVLGGLATVGLAAGLAAVLIKKYK